VLVAEVLGCVRISPYLPISPDISPQVLGCVRISHVSLANGLIPAYCGTEGEDE